MTWVFAYGSNMHLADLERWMASRPPPRGRILRAEAAHAEGYRLVFNYYSPTRQGGAANVEAAPNRRLPGVAMELDEAALGAIDVKEGHPHRYHRSEARIVLANGLGLDAWIYMVRPEYRAAEPVLPTRHYRRLLVEGALEFGLPEAHITGLRKLETCD